MKQTLMITLLCLIASLSAIAQNAPQKPDTKPPAATDAMPSVDQILDKYVQALGGKAAIEKQTSTVATGTFELPAMSMSGPLEVYSKAPNKNAVIINIGGFGLVQSGFNGTVAWSQDPQSGLRELTASELADTKRDSEFHRDIKLKQLFPKMTVTGKEKVAERDVYVIEAIPTGGKPEKMYFDTQTGLLIRRDADRDGPQGSAHVETYFEDYKDVGGVKAPFTIKIVRPEISFTLKITDIKVNVPIDEAKFNKPAAQ
jgi:zinc protease